MPPLPLSCRAFCSSVLRANGTMNWIRCAKISGQLTNYAGARCFNTIVGVYTTSAHRLSGLHRDDYNSSLICRRCITQRRAFLGLGLGEGGSVLSRIHEERLLMGYSPEQLFNVVAAVDLYHGFVPWCQRSEILKHYPDGSFDAELEIGFKFLVESYISHVELERPKFIKTTAKHTGLFDHLINVWKFNPGPTPGTCELYFLVDFKFKSPLYRQVASVFFREVVSRLVSSFSERCRLVYGPGVLVPGQTYDRRI